VADDADAAAAAANAGFIGRGGFAPRRHGPALAAGFVPNAPPGRLRGTGAAAGAGRIAWSGWVVGQMRMARTAANDRCGGGGGGGDGGGGVMRAESARVIAPAARARAAAAAAAQEANAQERTARPATTSGVVVSAVSAGSAPLPHMLNARRN
jgi:hypothetical protein